ncbi:hypothetical protein COV16_07495 [Candidatus Woesearchaeota archaeon CG10_big_fil_rev_8_21_14_0_10_34_8]|nr:MAG: hypothetical protein COV16_07495 [Candidatus Woesearchaeota archaeon CG10_big_fil_rev_8_21_14_0_10_34_8]
MYVLAIKICSCSSEIFAEITNCLRKRLIINVLNITQTNHNFIESKRGETPGMREGITKKILTWNDIFNMRLSINV